MQAIAGTRGTRDNGSDFPTEFAEFHSQTTWAHRKWLTDLLSFSRSGFLFHVSDETKH